MEDARQYGTHESLQIYQLLFIFVSPFVKPWNKGIIPGHPIESFLTLPDMVCLQKWEIGLGSAFYF